MILGTRSFLADVVRAAGGDQWVRMPTGSCH